MYTSNLCIIDHTYDITFCNRTCAPMIAFCLTRMRTRTIYDSDWFSRFMQLESRRRRTKGSVVGEEWCQNAAPLRWYTKNVFAQSKMILSRAWLHDTVSCAAWNDARKGVYLKPLFKTPCSNCYWGWSIPIMLDYRDISLMESVPLMWGPVTASPVGIEPMTIFGGGAPPPPYNWYPIHNGENSMNCTGWPPNTP